MAVLIVGATGLVGGEIARLLVKSSTKVSGLVRGGHAHPKAAHLVSLGVDVVEGDLTQPATLTEAVRNARTVVCTATSMPCGANNGLHTVDHDGTLALIDACERSGVKRFVYTSFSGNDTEASPLETAKRDCEARLTGSSMEAVILRPSFFMESWLSPALGFDPANGSARIYGDGEAKVSYISALDVAQFAAKAVVATLSGNTEVLELGGPKPVSLLEAVRVFEGALGTTARLEFVPQAYLEAQGDSPDDLGKTFGALMLAYAKGDVIADAAATAERYGISLRSVEAYAQGMRPGAAAA